MSTDNNNCCVPCAAAPCYRVLPHSPRSQDPTMSRFFSEGPALQGTVTSLLEGSALQSPSSGENSALQGLTSPEGPILQDTVSASGYALQNSVSETSPLPEKVQRTAPPVIITVEDSPSTVASAQTGSRSSTPDTSLLSKIHLPRQQEDLHSRNEAQSPFHPKKSLPKASRKSDSKKSQVGPIPIPKTSKSPVPDTNPTRGHRVANQPVIPTVDPDLEDLVPYDVPDDEESRRPPPVGPADHSQPLPSRPTGQEFQPPSIIPVQGFIPVRSSMTGSSELFQAPPGPFQQGLTDDELKQARS
ncbi:hypothetical protein GEMRC1_011516 [Eukaryota sp. GEM-RC1]